MTRGVFLHREDSCYDVPRTSVANSRAANFRRFTATPRRRHTQSPLPLWERGLLLRHPKLARDLNACRTRSVP